MRDAGCEARSVERIRSRVGVDCIFLNTSKLTNGATGTPGKTGLTVCRNQTFAALPFLKTEVMLLIDFKPSAAAGIL
jgi:hypothetical protein